VSTPRSSRRRKRSPTLGDDSPVMPAKALSDRRESSIKALISCWSMVSIMLPA